MTVAWRQSESWQRTLNEIQRAKSDTVLVLGSGFHRQAGSGWAPLDWSSLVRWRSADTKQPIDSHALPLAWEGAALDDLAHDPGADSTTAADDERKHLRQVAERLKMFYPRGGAHGLGGRVNSWVHQVHRATLQDLVVFNFDLTFEELEGHEPSTAQPRGGHRTNQGRTRLWYPHGHVHASDEIVLGARRYGLELTRLEEARKDFWTRRRPTSSEIDLIEPRHWLDLFLQPRPLLLMGLGMSPDEWTLWWALTQRARRFRNWQTVPRPMTTVFLKIESDPAQAAWHKPWLAEATQALGIEVVQFTATEASDMWELVLRTLGEQDDSTTSSNQISRGATRKRNTPHSAPKARAPRTAKRT